MRTDDSGRVTPSTAGHREASACALSPGARLRAAIAASVARAVAASAPRAVAAAALLVALVVGALWPLRAPAEAQASPWRLVMNGLYGDVVDDIVLTGRPPQSGRGMLLLPRGRGLFLIDDYGEGWIAVQANTERPRAPVFAAAVGGDDEDGRLVYAGLQGRQRLARSQDGGRTWYTMTGPPAPERVDRLASSAPTGHLYAAQSDRDRLYHSTDRGGIWTGYSLPGTEGPVDELFAAPDDPIVYMVRSGDLWRSNNSPTGWRQVLGPVALPPVTVTLEVSLASVGVRGRLFAAGRAGASWLVRGSVDRGDSWQYSGWPDEAGDAEPVALGAGEVRPGLVGVWVGTADGRVFASQDMGRTWTFEATLPRPPTRIVVDGDSFDVWVGTEGLGLFRINPDRPVHTGAVSVYAQSVVATEGVSGPRAVLLAEVLPSRRADDGAMLPPLQAVYTSTDGTAWFRGPMTSGLGSRLLASPDWDASGRMYSGSLTSTDRGLTWRPLGSSSPGVVPTVLAVGPLTATHPVLYALEEPYVDGGGGVGLVLSEDGGATWQHAETMQSGIVALVVSPAFVRDRTAIFVTDRGQVYRSTDGLLFGAVGRVPSSAPLERTVYDLVVSPGFDRDGVLFAAVDDPVAPQHAHVYVSASRGETWQARDALLYYNSRPRRLLLSPDFPHDRVVFVGGERRDADSDMPTIFASDSAGVDWFMEAFLPPSIVHDFAWQGDVESGAVLAATGAGGLWRRDLSVPIGPTDPEATPSATRTATGVPDSPTPTSDGPSSTPGTPDASATPDATPDATATADATPDASATPDGTPGTETSEPGATTPAGPSPTDGPSETPRPTDHATPTDPGTPDPSDTPGGVRGHVFLPIAIRS